MVNTMNLTTEAETDPFGRKSTKEGKDSMENAPKQSAIDSQVDGNHYTDQGVQPVEITFQNFGYEGIRAALYTKVNKYLTREKGTHRKDITKAIHCLEMQVEFYDRHNALEEKKL